MTENAFDPNIVPTLPESHMVLKTMDITKKINGHFDRENRGQLGNRGQGKSQLHYLSRSESLKGGKA
jgi:hypothetical protein